MFKKEEEKEAIEEKKEGCLATLKWEERSGLAELGWCCWFSSLDFTLRDKSLSVMEGYMAVVSTWNAMKTALLPNQDISSHT